MFRPFLARVSGIGLGRGSIGGAKRGNFADNETLMSETASQAPANLSRDAEIASALGKRSVVLIGMMGAGKSTIGRRMAARLRLPFLDADTEIEAAAGMSI